MLVFDNGLKKKKKKKKKKKEKKRKKMTVKMAFVWMLYMK